MVVKWWSNGGRMEGVRIRPARWTGGPTPCSRRAGQKRKWSKMEMVKREMVEKGNGLNHANRRDSRGWAEHR